ncbi:MAG: GDSL-type esterase/lipase family protein [Akkermansiaceae bacterium]
MKSIAPIIALLTAASPLYAQTTTPDAPTTTVSSTPVPRGDFWLNRHNNQVKNANTTADKCQLVFIGDSITQAWQTPGRQLWKDNFTQYNALNLGISGDQTQHVIWRLQNGAFPETLNPKVAVVMIGTNNTGSRQPKPPQDTADAIKIIIDEIHQRSPRTQIILHAIFPRGATPTDPLRIVNTQVNQTIAQLGKRNYVHYLDINKNFLTPDGTLTKEIMPDLLHPKAKGYKIWTDALIPVIQKLINDPLTSPTGFKATFVPLPAEGQGLTEIWKNGEKIATIKDAKPIAFSPTSDILLLKEHAPDDDTKPYLLDIGKSQFTIKGNRQDHVFGSRYVTSAKWSPDGTTITLTNAPGMSAKDQETFKVADLLK